MTSEEKQKKAEEKARRRAEAAERSAKRRVYLAALKRYWYFLRHDINGRACPQDFFLFWARQLLFASQKLTVFLVNYGGEAFRIATILPVVIIIIAILCAIFPPILFIVAAILTSLAIGINMWINVALVFSAAYAPIFLAGVKRRINDMSTTAAVAHMRFLLFAMSVVGTLVAFIVCSLSWFWEVSSFMKGGSMFWLTSLSYILLAAGIALVTLQMYYYSYCPGVSGPNFAGDNPIETGISEESLGGQCNRIASRSWQVLSIVLIVAAAAIAFSLSSEFIQGICDVWKKLESDLLPSFFKLLDYGMLALITICCLFVCCVKRKYEKGLLAASEIDSINECFRPKSAADIGALVAKAEQGEEVTAIRQRVPGLFTRTIELGIRVCLSVFYYGFVVAAIVILLKDCFALSVMLIAMAFGGLICRYYFNWKLEKDACAIDWRAIVIASAKGLLSLGRAVVLLPFTLSDSKVSDDTKLPTIARKRLRIRNMSFIDPLGIHQLMLGQMDMCGIQVMFCVLIVGIPVSWLWSIFDGIRFSKMTDEQFLMEYSDYCFTKGIKDKFVALTSKMAVIMAPIVGALVLLAAVWALAGDGSAECPSKESICIRNMEHIASAYLMSKTDGKNAENISDLCSMKYLNEVPKCPSGGQYRFEDGRVICSVDTAKIEKQRKEEASRAEKQRVTGAQKEAYRDACIKNMEEIESAYGFAKEEGKKVKSISDLNEFLREKFKDTPDYKDLPTKCPSGGKYKLDQYGHVTCSRNGDGHILK